MTRKEKVMDGAAYWGSFFRNNPDKFCEQYLHIRLKKFQRIIILMMFWSTIFVLIACRGIGKTFISAVYCCTRAILYPGQINRLACMVTYSIKLIELLGSP